MFPSSCCPEQRQHFIIFLLANIFFGTTLWILYVMQALRWLLCLVCNPPLVSGPIESVSCTVLNTWRQKNYNSTSPLYTSQEMISERPNRKEQDRRRYKTPSSFLKNYKKNQGFKLYFQCLSFRAMLLASFTTGSFYSIIHELFQCLNSPRMLCQLYKLLLLDWYPEILLGLYKERKIQTLKFLECSFRHHLHLINRLHKCNVNNSGLPQESCSEAGSL